PFELGLGGLEIVAVEMEARGHQRAHRRIQRARIALDQRAAGIAQRLGVARLRRLGERFVQACGLRRLARLVPAPALPAGERDRAREHGADDQVAVLLPPRLQLGYLLLLFEIEW